MTNLPSFPLWSKVSHLFLEHEIPIRREAESSLGGTVR